MGEFVEWLGYPVEKLNIVGLYNLIYNASVMVREGLGIALTLEGLINTTGNTPLRFVPLKPRITARLVLAWRKGVMFCPAAGKLPGRLPISSCSQFLLLRDRPAHAVGLVHVGPIPWRCPDHTFGVHQFLNDAVRVVLYGAAARLAKCPIQGRSLWH